MKSPAPTTESPGSLRGWWYRLAVAIAVSPIVITAVRLGLAGWEPSWDSATTVVRIREVFSAHPPLTGMAAAPSTGADAPYSFPGAFHLYLLAVPVKILGTTWGVVVGMAAINVAACVTGLWLLRRRLGERWAIVGSVVLGSLLWTFGSETLILPTPLVVGVVPLFTFFVAAWSVADLDLKAVPVLAVVGNYLFLNQLVFIVVVPVVGLVALVSFGVGMRRLRRSDTATWAGQRTRRRRWIGVSVLVSVVVWIPPLVDQFRPHGGNLGRLLSTFTSGEVSNRQEAEFAPSLSGALGVVTSITAVPRWWLPPTFDDPPFRSDGGVHPIVLSVICAVVLFGLLVWSAWQASRRGDRRVVTAVLVAVTAWCAYLVTAWKNPDSHGYYQRYFLGLWPLAAFMWLVVAVGVVTAFPRLTGILRRNARVGVLLATVGLVVIAGAASNRPARSFALYASGERRSTAEVRRIVRDASLPDGPIRVAAEYHLRSQMPSVLLGLQDQGIDFRVRGPFDVEQFGLWRDHDTTRDAVAMIRLTEDPALVENEQLLGTTDQTPAEMDDEQFDRIETAIVDWMENTSPIRANPDVPGVDAAGLDELSLGLEMLLDDAGGDGRLVLERDEFIAFVAAWGNVSGAPLFEIPTLGDDDLRDWGAEKKRRTGGKYYLVLRHTD